MHKRADGVQVGYTRERGRSPVWALCAHNLARSLGLDGLRSTSKGRREPAASCPSRFDATQARPLGARGRKRPCMCVCVRAFEVEPGSSRPRSPLCRKACVKHACNTLAGWLVARRVQGEYKHAEGRHGSIKIAAKRGGAIYTNTRVASSGAWRLAKRRGPRVLKRWQGWAGPQERAPGAWVLAR